MSTLRAPTVVDIRDVAKPGQPLPMDVVYIGRRWALGGWDLDGSPWANPWSVKRYGRDQALRLYHRTILGRLDRQRITHADLAALTGQRLACWCKRNDHRCHGDVLVEIGAELGLWEIEEG